jgi:hypothetical protein
MQGRPLWLPFRAPVRKQMPHEGDHKDRPTGIGLPNQNEGSRRDGLERKSLLWPLQHIVGRLLGRLLERFVVSA